MIETKGTTQSPNHNRPSPNRPSLIICANPEKRLMVIMTANSIEYNFQLSFFAPIYYNLLQKNLQLGTYSVGI